MRRDAIAHARQVARAFVVRIPRERMQAKPGS